MTLMVICENCNEHFNVELLPSETISDITVFCPKCGFKCTENLVDKDAREVTEI